MPHSGVHVRNAIYAGMTCIAQQISSCLSLFSLKHVFLLLLHNGNQGTLCPAFKLLKLLCHVPPQIPICFLGGHIDDGFTLQSMKKIRKIQTGISSSTCKVMAERSAACQSLIMARPQLLLHI